LKSRAVKSDQLWAQASGGMAMLTQVQVPMLLAGIDWRRPGSRWRPEGLARCCAVAGLMVALNSSLRRALRCELAGVIHRRFAWRTLDAAR
jgi:hypothetical protein